MTLSILFVDDEPNLLCALQRALRARRDAWDMQFADSGQAALRLMEARRFDVVVSDMRMLEMDGAALLTEVEARQPGAIRIILSGYAEKASVLRTVGPAHQYIAKPVELDAIAAVMDRAIARQRFLTSPPLRTLVSGLRTLPSPPGLFLRLVKEIGADNAAPKAIARMIAEDPAMTAALLKITNSSYFGLSKRIADPLQAVLLLGVETVRSLVLSAGIFRQFGKDARAAPVVQALNEHSLAQAALARRFALEDGASPARCEQAVLAAVLGRIGDLILLEADPDGYLAVLADPGAAPGDTERARFGATAAEVGAYLLGLWGFVDDVVEAVLFQANPSGCPNPEKSALTYAHAAACLAPPPAVPGRTPSARAADEAYLRQVGLEAKLAEWRSAAGSPPVAA